jgi:hypothetical protein
MSLALMLALQAAAPAEAGAAAPAPFAALDFDLARYRPAGAGPAGRGCRIDDPAPITVCARRPAGGDYPIEQWAPLFAHRPVVAQSDLGRGLVASSYIQQVELDRGAVSNRIMVGIGLAF